MSLVGVLNGYSVWNIYLAETGAGPYAEQIKATPELGSMLGWVDDLYKTVALAMYGSLIVLLPSPTCSSVVSSLAPVLNPRPCFRCQVVLGSITGVDGAITDENHHVALRFSERLVFDAFS